MIHKHPDEYYKIATASADAIREKLWSCCSPEPMSGCWLWIKGKSAGYGKVWIKISGKAVQFMAHRLNYTVCVGVIPEELDLDHKCRNPACINPDHLEPVPHRENLMRGVRRGGEKFGRRDRCSKGHVYTSETSYLKIRSDGRSPYRVCRICMRRWDREHKLRNKEKANANSSGNCCK
jgi:hypothetical protein